MLLFTDANDYQLSPTPFNEFFPETRNRMICHNATPLAKKTIVSSS
jgi:hypothetical protein